MWFSIDNEDDRIVNILQWAYTPKSQAIICDSDEDLTPIKPQRLRYAKTSCEVDVPATKKPRVDDAKANSDTTFGEWLWHLSEDGKWWSREWYDHELDGWYKEVCNFMHTLPIACTHSMLLVEGSD
jgi:hypothetical protein